MQSRAWYALCALPMSMAVVFALDRYESLVAQIDGMQRMRIPGRQMFQLEKGDYLVYGESEGEVAGGHVSNPSFTFETPCSLVDRAGGTVALEHVALRFRKYQVGGHRGRSMFRFTTRAAGPFALDCEGDGTGTAVVAIGAILPFLTVTDLVIVVLLGAVLTVIVFWIVQGRLRAREDA